MPSVGAQYRLRQLESKKEALESRLRDLADGFEQATVDKNEQENKRVEMQEHLQEAAYYRKVLREERERCTTVLDAYEASIFQVFLKGPFSLYYGLPTYCTMIHCTYLINFQCDFKNLWCNQFLM